MRRQALGLQGRPGLEQWIGKTWDATVFAPSEQARNVARPVARVVTMPGPGYSPQGVATGFLVTPRLFLTNHHVFPEKSYTVGYGANFLHERDERGEQEGVFFELDPDAFYLSDKQLDFALVGICGRGTNGERIEDLGAVRLIEATGKILIGYPVNIIQHPKGGPRQYAVTNNHLLDILDVAHKGRQSVSKRIDLSLGVGEDVVDVTCGAESLAKMGVFLGVMVETRFVNIQ